MEFAELLGAGIDVLLHDFYKLTNIFIKTVLQYFWYLLVVCKAVVVALGGSGDRLELIRRGLLLTKLS